jgi:intracellular septation protein
MTNKKENIAKFLCDYLPLIVFFIAYKIPKNIHANLNFEPLIFATICLVFTTFICLLLSYFLVRKISYIALFSGLILAIFGGLTAFFNNEFFIKIKPTIINLIFAVTLFYGYWQKKPLLSIIFENKISMKDEAWHQFSLRWALYFVFLAILNEIIWRNFTTEFWVDFKVFGMMTLTIIFTIIQMPFLARNIQNKQ